MPSLRRGNRTSVAAALAALELTMPTSLRLLVTKYLQASNPSHGTRAEYRTTLRKWADWGSGVPVEKLGRREIFDFLEWVYHQAVEKDGTKPGRTANKAREHLRAVISWAWDQEMIDAPPRFPKKRDQRDV